MKALVVYLSQTGNTKRVAEAIFEEIPCEKEIKKMEEVTDTAGYDIIFAGFPVWQFGPAEPAKKFLSAYGTGRNLALFITHAMDPSSENIDDCTMLNEIIARCKASGQGGNLLGLFNCQGELSKNIAEFLLKNENPSMRRFGEMRSLTIGHPDINDLNSARQFTQSVMKAVNKF